jgi:hypothetical protein
MRIQFKIRPPATASSPRTVRVDPARIRVTHRPLRVLDFDCEARPLHWISGDYVSKEITAIAWAWCDTPEDVRGPAGREGNDQPDRPGRVLRVSRQSKQCESEQPDASDDFLHNFPFQIVTASLRHPTRQ